MAAREPRAFVAGFGVSLIIGSVVLLASPRPERTAEGPRTRVPFSVVLLVVLALGGIGFLIWYGLSWSDWTF